MENGNSHIELKEHARPGRPGRKPRVVVDTTRVQLDLSRQGLDRLTGLRDKIGSSSYAETIREALWAYEGLVEAAERGDEVVIKTRNSKGEVYEYPFRYRSSM